MKALLICALVLIALTALWFLLSAVCFKKAVVRMPPVKREVFLSGPRQKYLDSITAGEKWIADQVTERVTISSRDGLKLSARLYLHPEARGILLFFHGYRSSADIDISCGAEYYYSLGFSLLLADQRCHGKSEGKYITFGIREKDDCVLWSEYCARRFGADFPQVLGGLSMGATTVLMAAGQALPPAVKCVIADCGFSSPADIMREVIRSSFHLPSWLILSGIAFYAKHCAGFSIRAYSTYDAMRVNRLPILFIHGTADDFVPDRMSVECWRRCTAPKELVLVDGAAHGLSYLIDTPRCQKALRDFLDKYVK